MTENKIQPKNTFPKEEKLCYQKSIDRLFAYGQSFIAYPLRVVYIVEEELDMEQQFPKVLISVSKRKFKRANKRNRVKRLIREAYRLNKTPFLELLRSRNEKIDIAFLYLKDELPTYQEMEKSILKASAILAQKLAEKKHEEVIN